MRKLALVLGWVVVSGCAAEDPPDPLASVSGFCEAWSERVCTQDIVDVCGSPSVDKCKAAQVDDCLERIDDGRYTASGAAECLDAASKALLDAQLNLKEYSVLTQFGEQCNKLLTGPGEDGDACESDIDCDTTEGLECIKSPGSPEGECHEPDFIDPGGKCSGEAAVCQQGTYCYLGKNCIDKLEIGEECDAQNPCADDFLCSGVGDGGASTCISKVENGDGCSSNAECQSGLCSKVEELDQGRCTNRIVLSANAAECSALR
jgi:hypothetical protein